VVALDDVVDVEVDVVATRSVISPLSAALVNCAASSEALLPAFFLAAAVNPAAISEQVVLNFSGSDFCNCCSLLYICPCGEKITEFAALTDVESVLSKEDEELSSSLRLVEDWLVSSCERVYSELLLLTPDIDDIILAPYPNYYQNMYRQVAAEPETVE